MRKKKWTWNTFFSKKRNRVWTGIIIFVFLFGYFFVYRPITRINVQAREVSASAKALKYAFSQNDIDLVKKQLDDLNKKYQELENTSKGIYWAAFIPYVGDYKNGVEAGDYILKATNDAIAAITPYADLIGFKKGGSSFAEKSAEDRLQTAILTLDKVLTKIDVISANIEQAKIRIDKIDPNHYPEKIGKTVVKSNLANFKQQFDAVASLLVDAKPLLKNIPAIFGKDKEKTYLLLFQNDKELRATGGFLTSYAVFKVKDGKLSVQNSEDIYTLDNSISSHPVARPEILAYHKNVYQFYIRDSNLSPDFVKSVELFNSLYKNSSQKVSYDGIFALDSKVLIDMLTIYGDTEVDGVRFSANKDPRCDCAQVLYTLFDIVDRPVNYVKENRKGILGDLMFALLNKALGFSPSKYYGKLTQTMYQDLQMKHILLYFTDPQLEASAEKIDFAGRINNFNGDYLHINNVNFAGAKSNLFVSTVVDSKTTTKSSGTQREIAITYTNPYPPSDCNLERGGLCLNAQLRNWLRVYVPQGSKLVKFEGSETPVKTYNDLGKTVFEGFLRVNPQGLAKVNIIYTLPTSLSTSPYKLMVQKQPGVDNQTLKVEIDGKKLYDNLFDTDKTFDASQ